MCSWINFFFVIHQILQYKKKDHVNGEGESYSLILQLSLSLHPTLAIFFLVFSVSRFLPITLTLAKLRRLWAHILRRWRYTALWCIFCPGSVYLLQFSTDSAQRSLCKNTFSRTTQWKQCVCTLCFYNLTALEILISVPLCVYAFRKNINWWQAKADDYAHNYWVSYLKTALHLYKCHFI